VDGSVEIEALSDEELVARSRNGSRAAAEVCLEALYRRHRPAVARWCLRVCGDREEAADLAQEVFLRVHQRLDTFRAESRFSTWLYTVTRNVCINHGMAARRQAAASLDDEAAAEPMDPAPGPGEQVERDEIAARFREAFSRDLEPLEAQSLYLHHVLGVPVAGVTALLELENRSGAKALLVSGTRKLKRRFGRWLEAQAAGTAGRTS